MLSSINIYQPSEPIEDSSVTLRFVPKEKRKGLIERLVKQQDWTCKSRNTRRQYFLLLTPQTYEAL